MKLPDGQFDNTNLNHEIRTFLIKIVMWGKEKNLLFFLDKSLFIYYDDGKKKIRGRIK